VIVFEAGVRDVVNDSDREMILRGELLQFIEDALGHCRRELLGRKAKPSTDDSRTSRPGLVKSRHDIKIKRFGDTAGFLGAVEHRDRSRGLGILQCPIRQVAGLEQFAPHLRG